MRTIIPKGLTVGTRMGRANRTRRVERWTRLLGQVTLFGATRMAQPPATAA